MGRRGPRPTTHTGRRLGLGATVHDPRRHDDTTRLKNALPPASSSTLPHSRRLPPVISCSAGLRPKGGDPIPVATMLARSAPRLGRCVAERRARAAAAPRRLPPSPQEPAAHRPRRVPLDGEQEDCVAADGLHQRRGDDQVLHGPGAREVDQAARRHIRLGVLRPQLQGARRHRGPVSARRRQRWRPHRRHLQGCAHARRSPAAERRTPRSPPRFTLLPTAPLPQSQR